MATTQSRSKRKVSGGLYKKAKAKRKFELGREPTLPKLGERKIKKQRTIGGNTKIKILKAEFANVSNPKAKTVKKVKITGVLENPANPHYVRRNIITKGTIIDTELGKAKVTSRPGQEGAINAVLI
jgi:small subunit ribosomal protein S8e